MGPNYPKLQLDQPAAYQIKIQGRLDEKWSGFFDGMRITIESSPHQVTLTTLTGTVMDQAGLHGMLNQIRDLGLPLVLVEWLS